jgi:formylglycine-generating enzyme required for sulfatase activity
MTAAATHDVFISYSSKDKPAADAVCVTLESRGIRCWYAPRDIPAGSTWARSIPTAIRGSRVMILVFSRHANASEWVAREVNQAINDRLLLIPMRIEDVPPSDDMEFYLRTRHWLDAFAPPLDRHLTVLATQVANYLSSLPGPSGQERAAAPPRPVAPTALDGPVAQSEAGGPADLPECLRRIAWCDVPAGPFLYGENKKRRTVERPCRIGKYPVTYEQFQAFVDAPDGFRNPQWWRGLHADGLTQQHGGPGKQRWPVANHPRERVSWYDAMAFCKWLSDKLGYVVTLPTEEQWEKAARGENGLIYPYGDKFDSGKCNTGEGGPGQTTSVDRYPDGASPYGALDMSGNVWEWTLTDFASGGNDDLGASARRVLRGGSWYSRDSSARAAFRGYYVPGDRDNSCGFRLASPALNH